MSIHKVIVFFAGCILSTSAWAAAPVLTLGKISGHAGSVVDLPVNFDPGTAAVSGIQFNVTVPTNASITSVKAGDSSTAAGKSVSSNQHGQTWTFLIFGLNQTTDQKGTLLTAKVKLAPGTSAGTFKLPVSGVVYADPNGRPIPAGTSKPGILTVN
jgi:hypothetical protein